jgi:hypothetical protein
MKGGTEMSENTEIMVDVVTFVDDEGNEFDMEIIEEFEHKGKKYAVLAELEEECDCDHEECDCDCGCEEESLYIFEVVQGEEGEEFVSIEDDDLMNELSTVVEDMLFEEEE